MGFTGPTHILSANVQGPESLAVSGFLFWVKSVISVQALV